MQIELTDAGDPAHRAAILAPLIAHNQASTGRKEMVTQLAVLLRDADGQVEGGFWGSLNYDWFKLEYAFLPAHRRRNRLGARILSSLEAAAEARGAVGAWMQSFSFQAPEFYQKQGYRQVGVLHDRPPGHYDVVLAKDWSKGAPCAAEGATLVVTEDPTPEERLAIRRGILGYSDQFAGPSDWRDLAILLRNDAGEIVGGLWGRTGRSWLYVDLFALPPELRGTGMGTRLIRMAEAEARDRGCIGAWLDTFSFQARPFYEKLGYTVFAEIPDYPAGHSRYFLSHRLDQA